MKYADSDAADYYDNVKTGFEEGNLDAAFITMGVRAQIFNDLADTGKCEIVSIPNRNALLQNNLYLSQYTIHAGMYGDQPHIMPYTEVETVASGAQLLTRENANVYLVEAVTSIVLDKNFARIEGNVGIAGGFRADGDDDFIRRNVMMAVFIQVCQFQIMGVGKNRRSGDDLDVISL